MKKHFSSLIHPCSWQYIPAEKWDTTGNSLQFFNVKGDHNCHFSLAYSFPSFASLLAHSDRIAFNLAVVIHKLATWVLGQGKITRMTSGNADFLRIVMRSNIMLYLQSCLVQGISGELREGVWHTAELLERGANLHSVNEEKYFPFVINWSDI